MMESMISDTFVLASDKPNNKKRLPEALMLTSLVDAFSILVIFLLLNFSESENFLVLGKDTVLPAAKRWAELEKSTVIKIENDRLFVGDEEVKRENLVARLVTLKKELVTLSQQLGLAEPGVIIQADRATRYGKLNDVVSALAQTGFSDVNFAVLQN